MMALKQDSFTVRLQLHQAGVIWDLTVQLKSTFLGLNPIEKILVEFRVD